MRTDEFYEHKIVKVEDLIPYAMNARTHSDEQVSQIAANIREFGFTNAVLIDEKSNLIAGHGRILAARKLKMIYVPAIVVTGLTDERRRALIIADNKLALNAGWDEDMLISELSELAPEYGELMGFSEEELVKLLQEDRYADGVKGSMADTYGVAPFSVLNAREGAWQNRKRAWVERGIASDEGREENLLDYAHVNVTQNGTSIFDPVLCELLIKWFTAENDFILDPFAGGSVRGLVSYFCERRYLGVDVRQEQIEANISQADQICEEGETPSPIWLCGDSINIPKLIGPQKFDAVLSCPPYGDLEVYSDNPQDLSTMEYEEFLTAYQKIIKNCFDALEDNRFAFWVIGEIRDKNGHYRNFLGDTIASFIQAGFEYYNEAVLVTAAGSLALRAGRLMRAGRKLGKTHQNILVFVKGNWKKAVERLGEIEMMAEPADPEEGTETEYGVEI